MAKQIMSAKERQAYNDAMAARVGTKRDLKTKKRTFPKFDVTGRRYIKPAHTLRGIGGDPENEIANTHFVVIPAGVSEHIIETAVTEVVAWLEDMQEREAKAPKKARLDAQEKASG